MPAIGGVAFLADNKSVVSAGGDNAVRVWVPAAVRVFAGHQGPILSVAVLPNGSQIYTASADKSIKVFRRQHRQRSSARSPGHTGAVKAVAVTKDGTKLISGSDDKTFRVWNVADGKPLLTTPAAPRRCGGRGRRGQQHAGGRRAGRRDAQGLRPDRRRCRQGRASELQGYGLAGDGGRVPARSGDAARRLRRQGRLALGAPVDGRARRTWLGHTGQIYNVVWSPDGKLAATAAADKTARLWDVAKAAQVRQINAHEKVAYAVAFNPKGDLLATGGDDKLIKYWNVADGKELRKSQGHGAPIYSLAFHPDGTKLASGSVDKTIRIWNVADGKELHKLDGHPDDVYAVAFSPDGKKLASVGYGGNLYRLGRRDRQGLVSPACRALHDDLWTGVEPRRQAARRRGVG